MIGSGFGGLFATRALGRAPVEITVVAKTTHHLFQPVLDQVATGILAGEIAPATRHMAERVTTAQQVHARSALERTSRPPAPLE